MATHGEYISNDDLFKFMIPSNNDKVSDMKGTDLLELIGLLDNYLIVLRDYLGFLDCITIGLELESEYADRGDILSEIEDAPLINTWQVKSDSTLHEGVEVNSPVLRDEEVYWEDLDTVCNIMDRYSRIGPHAGAHIHIGTPILGNNTSAWLNFIKLWSVYENIIYRFTYGEYLTARSTMNEFATPASTVFWNDYTRLKDGDLHLRGLVNHFSHQRRQAVNFNNVKDFNNYGYENTIEFRCPNGTLDPVIWQNNVNLFINVLRYAKDKDFDHDTIDRRHLIIGDKYTSLTDYNEIYLEQALELCDMLYSNNLDKINFLRQYLKSFMVASNPKDYKKIRRFTKKKD